jgi:uncharacterized protein (TIGR02271 family)
MPGMGRRENVWESVWTYGEKHWVETGEGSLSKLRATRAPMTVIDANGMQGVVVEDAQMPPNFTRYLLVRFENGQQMHVPLDILTLREDGRYYLATSIETLLAEQTHSEPVASGADNLTPKTADESTLVVPVIDETLTVHTRQRETGLVQIRKTIHERIETVDPLLYAEEVEVERVAVNRFVDAPMPVRHEEDTTIIPLLEEVLVVEKRLLLREEVRITKARREVHNPQTVKLREERVEIVRKPDGEQGNQPADTQ